MSLNKFTNSSDYLEKQYINLGCNDIKCSSLQIGGEIVNSNISGSYIPIITINDGSQAINEVSNFVITKYNDSSIVDLTLHCRMIAQTQAAGYNVTIKLPLGYKSVFSDPVPCVGYLKSGSLFSQYLCLEAQSSAGSDEVTILFVPLSNTQIPAGTSDNYIQCSLKIQAQK